MVDFFVLFLRRWYEIPSNRDRWLDTFSVPSEEGSDHTVFPVGNRTCDCTLKKAGAARPRLEDSLVGMPETTVCAGLHQRCRPVPCPAASSCPARAWQKSSARFPGFRSRCLVWPYRE